MVVLLLLDWPVGPYLLYISTVLVVQFKINGSVNKKRKLSLGPMRP
jgi:hypothetical protein